LALSPHLLLCLAVLVVAFERILIGYITLGFAFLPPQTHTRAFASGQNGHSKLITRYVYYALAIRAIGIIFATNMQFLRIIYKIFFSVSFSTSAILLFGLSIIRAVPESIIDSCTSSQWFTQCIIETVFGIDFLPISNYLIIFKSEK